jgi:hypothetical protein
MAEGIAKAVFTTSPKVTTEVVVERDGKIVLQPARAEAQAAAQSSA